MAKLFPTLCVLLVLLFASAKTRVSTADECTDYLGHCTPDCPKDCSRFHPGPQEQAKASCQSNMCFCSYQCGGPISNQCRSIFILSSCDECGQICSNLCNGKAACNAVEGGGNICQCQYDC